VSQVCAKGCGDQVSTTYSFKVKVTEAEKIPEIIFEVPNEEVGEVTGPEENFVPSESQSSTLDIQIANITRVALVTVQFSEPLKIEESYLDVFYEQMSEEAEINFSWTL
jgi:hypothetical protein